MNFNSTMVRLKAGFRWAGNGKLEKFQFHYGSVKRKPGMFYTACYQNFNSTMVRLKGSKALGRLITRQNFNSTMVRLKVGLRVIINYIRTKFQFHYGSVKRHLQGLA